MSRRYSINRGDHWELSFHLVFDSTGDVRLTRGEPDLNRIERSMAMTVKLPKAMFKVPTLQATMTIEAPEPMVPPINLTAAAEALKASLGVDVDVQIKEPSE